MKIAERERKATQFMETEFAEMLRIMLGPKYALKKKSKKTHAKKVKTAKKATAVKTKRAPKTSAPMMRPAAPPPALTREETQRAAALARKGSQTHKWQYMGDNNKWADYHPDASKVVEKAYSEWLVHPYVDVRAVHSGDWDYMVDFNTMQQQNIKHPSHKMRKIQRVPVA